MCRGTQNRALVAVCDILGFSDLVRQRPLREIVDYHLNNFQAALGSSIPGYPALPAEPTDDQILRQGLVGFVSFSDTVILYSLQDTRDGYRAVINAATILLARHILWPGLRFRIGISYGDFYFAPERNIYVGRALIDAHELERAQDWCGAALTDSADNLIADRYPDSHFLSRYDVPMRNGQTESHRVINWTLANHDVIPIDNGWMERENVADSADAQAAERKLLNTERFHAEMCVQCRSRR